MANEMTRAILLGVSISIVLMLVYLALEPVIGRSATTNDTFTVSQEITGEISFATPASDVTLDPPISSLTGGTSTGETQVIVATNNSSGYNMTIHFDDAPAMQGDVHGGTIPDYSPVVGGTPDYNFAVAANSAGFAYSVEASTTADVDPTFLDNNTDTCGVGSFNTANKCWFNPETSGGAETIINRTTVLPTSGATSTIKFQLVVRANPSPAVLADTYTATATLTATTNN